MSTGGLDHRLGSGRVPLTGRPQARVDIGRAFGNAAELQGTARLHQLMVPHAGDQGPRGLVQVALAGHHPQRQPALTWHGHLDALSRRLGRHASEGADAFRPPVAHPLSGHRDDPQHRAASLDQGNVDRELAIARHELLGAIERVHQPETFGRTRALVGHAAFLGHDGDVRRQGLQARHDALMRRQVGRGQWTCIGLVHHGGRTAVVDGHDVPPGRFGQGHHRGHQRHQRIRLCCLHCHASRVHA